MPLNYTLESLSGAIGNVLGSQIETLIEKINKEPGSAGSPFISLPDGSEGISKDHVTRLIAKTSNEYAAACRLAGLARAQYKIAYARHKHKFRISLGTGKNAGEREKPAHIASQVEYEQ